MQGTLGWINHFIENGPKNLVAATLPCPLLGRELDAVVHAGAGAVSDAVQLRQPARHHPFGDEDLQVRAAAQQALRELHACPHVQQQLLQLGLLQVQQVFLLHLQVLQLLQQPLPVLLDGFHVPAGKQTDLCGHGLCTNADGTAHAIDLAQCVLQGAHALLGAFQQHPQGVPVPVDNVAGQVIGVLPVPVHDTVPAHGLVTLLAEQPELLRWMGRAEERSPSLAAILAALQLCHSMRGSLLLSPRREQP